MHNAGMARTIYVYIMYIYVYTPCITVYLVISLPKTSYIHRIHIVLANPTQLRAARVQAH